jgi:hypothetical protein
VKVALVLSTLTISAVVSSAASADDKTACLAAATEGQTLRNGHELVEAREQFRICARKECPGAVQRDCGEWLDAVEKSLPTVVLSARDEGGHDLFDVAVTVDGKSLVTKLDGQSLPLNPGVHMFRFELADGTAQTQQVLVREGDKMHDVTVVLRVPTPSTGEVLPPSDATAAQEKRSAARPLTSDRGRTQRTLGLAIAGAGLVGLGVGAGLGLAAKSSDNRAEGETGEARYRDSGSAVSLGNLATVVFVVGGVAAAAGIVVWLTAPSAKAAVGTNGRAVFLGGSF